MKNLKLYTNKPFHKVQHNIPENFTDELFEKNNIFPLENEKIIIKFDDKARPSIQRSGSIGKALKTTIKQTIELNDLGAVIILQLVGQLQLIDLFGSHLGNTSIELVKSLISECLRLEDYVEQISEDEFAIVLENLVTPNDAEFVSQRILEKCEGTHSKNGQLFYIMATVKIKAIVRNEQEITPTTTGARLGLVYEQGSTTPIFGASTLRVSRKWGSN